MVREEPVTFRSMDAQLVGILHYPEGESKRAIVLCHGYTGDKVESKRLFVETARALARAGFLAFRFDFYGSGDSEGEFVETRVSTNVRNLLDALDYVRSKGVERLGLLGLSMGAATCILALDRGGRADCVALWSTVPDFKRLFETKAAEGTLEQQLPETYEYNGWLVHRDLVIDALGYDVKAAASRLTIPVLFVQGDADEALFVKGFGAFRAMGLPNAEFVMLEGAGHTFQTVRHRQQVIELTVRWFERHLI